MRNQYEQELRLLREEALKFAVASPELAGRLKLKSVEDSDPNLERLIEALAYLTTDIKRELAESEQKNCLSLLNYHYPSLVRDLPSCFVGRLTSNATSSTELPKDSLLLSSHTLPSLKFKLTKPSKYHACTIVSTQLLDDKIKLVFKPAPGVCAQQVLINGLSLYINAEWGVALNLYHLMVSKTESIDLLDSAGKTTAHKTREYLSACSLSTVGTDSGLHSNPDHHNLFTDWLTYFSFKESYLYVKIPSFEGVAHPMGEQFTLSFNLNTFPKNLNISVDTFVINTEVFINLSPMDCEPVGVKPGRIEYPMILSDTCYKVQSITEVVAIDSFAEQSEWGYLFDDRKNAAIDDFYTFHHKKIGEEDYLTYLSTVNRINPKKVRLSISTQVHQGNLPRETIFHSSCLGSISQRGIKFDVDNITRPTRCLYAFLEQDLISFHTSVLDAHLGHPLSAQALRNLLKLFDRSEDVANTRRRESICDISTRLDSMFKLGVYSKQLCHTITINSKAFINAGDVFLFAQILHLFLSRIASINYRVKLILIDQMKNILVEILTTHPAC